MIHHDASSISYRIHPFLYVIVQTLDCEAEARRIHGFHVPHLVCLRPVVSQGGMLWCIDQLSWDFLRGIIIQPIVISSLAFCCVL